MKESYVLKRRNGEACGYVMARDKEVRVRLPNEKGTAKMAVIYADQTQTLEGMLDGMERTYPAAGSRLLGAYVCSGGRLLMDTGEAARRASGGHRSGPIAAVAGAAMLLGTFSAGLDYASMAIGTIAAVVYVMSNRW